MIFTLFPPKTNKQTKQQQQNTHTHTHKHAHTHTQKREHCGSADEIRFYIEYPEIGLGSQFKVVVSHFARTPGVTLDGKMGHLVSLPWW